MLDAASDALTAIPYLPIPLTPSRPAGRSPTAVYLAGLAPRSRRTMRHALTVIANVLAPGATADAIPWESLRYSHTTAIRAVLSERGAAATTNTALAALRGVLKECWRLELVSAEEYRKAVDVANVKGTTLPRGRALSGGEFRALFAACDAAPAPGGIRDSALLAVLYAAGLRRSEAVGLDLAHYDTDAGALTVHGKGNKERLAYLHNGGRQAMADWIDIRGGDPGPLFFRIRQGGIIVHTRLTDQAVLDILQRRSTQAGVKACSPHDLRRSMISDLLDAGADISTVQRLAGHANVTTTQRYDRRGEATKQKASELIHIPYGRRAG
ncbi:MAG: integrase [Chloroflexi bacterium]|nr:MAG: integrase [Chloroflexota bacterium]